MEGDSPQREQSIEMNMGICGAVAGPSIALNEKFSWDLREHKTVHEVQFARLNHCSLRNYLL